MSTPGAARSVASSTSTPAQVQNASSAPASAVPSSGDGGERVPATAKFNGNKLEIHIGGKGNALTFSGEPTNGTRLVGMDAWSAASTGTIDRRPGAGDYEFSASYREDKIYVKLKCTDNSSLPDIQYIGRPDVITGKGTVS